MTDLYIWGVNGTVYVTEFHSDIEAVSIPMKTCFVLNISVRGNTN